MSRASANPFSADSSFVARSDQISSELDGEAAILNLKTGLRLDRVNSGKLAPDRGSSVSPAQYQLP
ncbi:MAG TPA: hypothetical protein VEF03_08445 [Candidatus Binataceae bacterium]|nr:hypothetical protein [Candidatus Binataceae bacterium]